MGFESQPNIEGHESEFRSMYQELVNALIFDVGDIDVWLNKYQDFLSEVVEDYQKENPHLLEEWDDLSKRDGMIKEIKSRTEALYRKKNLLPGEELETEEKSEDHDIPMAA